MLRMLNWFLKIGQILAPLPIGFAVFLVHLATIPITGTGINPARSLGAAIIFNKDNAWDDHVSVFHFSLIRFWIITFTNSLFYFLPVGLLGWTIHRCCTCRSIPRDSHQSHPIQVQKLIESLLKNYSFVLLLVCFLL